MRLETPQLSLYPLTPDQLRQAKRDFQGVLRSCGIKEPEAINLWESLERRRIYAAKAKIAARNPGAWLLATSWLAMNKSDRHMVAEVGFKGLDGKGESLELGYATLKKYQNQGFMSQAINALCQFAFTQTQYKVSRLFAYTLPGNIASHRVLAKNNFRRTPASGKYWLWERFNA
ncbi:MAG: GNAT family N-acetyltransferase [Oscillospiraceae bacterium]|nr:GNAT family N-acetyltransferase [Oscillospiraceae bacterium]